ncbi:hypothetical protein AD951_11050 [Acetobacter malorum]|uniref:Uncharacterized protein n=1 Tax=Acetobacter malorum TaxID=178901 RepID=A0A149UKW1_9PROT|nr:hypothetical protein AD951_11050 [Acetobacter malorum]
MCCVQENGAGRNAARLPIFPECERDAESGEANFFLQKRAKIPENCQFFITKSLCLKFNQML